MGMKNNRYGKIQNMGHVVEKVKGVFFGDNFRLRANG